MLPALRMIADTVSVRASQEEVCRKLLIYNISAAAAVKQAEPLCTGVAVQPGGGPCEVEGVYIPPEPRLVPAYMFAIVTLKTAAQVEAVVWIYRGMAAAMRSIATSPQRATFVCGKQSHLLELKFCSARPRRWLQAKVLNKTEIIDEGEKRVVTAGQVDVEAFRIRFVTSISVQISVLIANIL